MPKMTDTKTRMIDRLAFEAQLELDDGTPVTIGMNAEKFDWLQDYLPVLQFARGITESTTQIDSSAAFLMRKRAKRDGRRDISMNDLANVRRQVTNVMSQATDETFAELLSAVVLDYEDKIFEFEMRGDAIAVNLLPPFDQYEIPDWYFPNDKKQDPLKKMLQRTGQYINHEPQRDANHPIEIMCGITVGIMESNPKFAAQFRKYLDRATIAGFYGGLRLGDDADVFLKSVEGLLLDPLANDNDHDNGGNTANGNKPNHGGAQQAQVATENDPNGSQPE